jgi:hypothetical protein
MASKKIPKKRGGRPALPDTQRRSVRVVVLLTPDEWAKVERDAAASGMTTVELARQRVLANG